MKTPPNKEVKVKRFFSFIPRLAKKMAWARWRNNPPIITSIDESVEEMHMAFMMNKMVESWWKESGGHKKVWNKIKNKI